MTVICYLVGESTPRNVASVEEMDHLLDLAARDSTEDAGHAVVFYTDHKDSRLVVGVGRRLVPVIHGDDRPHHPDYPVGPYVISRGEIRGDEGEEMDTWRIDTAWNEIERNTLIPENVAREAAHEWFRTHDRPTNIQWQD